MCIHRVYLFLYPFTYFFFPPKSKTHSPAPVVDPRARARTMHEYTLYYMHGCVNQELSPPRWSLRVRMYTYTHVCLMLLRARV
jgi:hypothetical protein